VSESQLGSYLAYLESGVIPTYEPAAGIVRVYLLQRRFVAYAEVLTVSLWRSQQAVGRFVESQSLTQDVRQKYGVIEVEPRSFEVVLFRIRG
jgi:heme-degrading monooxygenase HmoA